VAGILRAAAQTSAWRIGARGIAPRGLAKIVAYRLNGANRRQNIESRWRLTLHATRQRRGVANVRRRVASRYRQRVWRWQGVA
jgi:hypothetical protein